MRRRARLPSSPLLAAFVLAATACRSGPPDPPPLVEDLEAVETARAWGDDPPARDTSEVLRVCADPNNLPFSNRAREGFENELAELIAEEMGRRVQYTWRPQRRGFIRHTLRAGLCDVVMGVPTTFELTATTAPYYRSTYVFVHRKDRGPSVRTLDDPALRELRIGVPVVGDDYSSTPGAQALGQRGLWQNLVGYTVFGSYDEPSPPSELIRAVARGEVDVAIAWGPLAGYFAELQEVELEIAPVSPAIDPPFTPFVFDVSMGVRRGEETLLARLDAILRERAPEIRALLERYRVPLVDGPGSRPAVAVTHDPETAP